MILKQSTAYKHKFLIVDSTSHVNGATGKTVAVELSKGPDAAGTPAAGAVTELDSSNLPGVYQIAFTIADTNTLGDLWLHATASGCDPTDECHQVQTQLVTDIQLNANGQVLIGSNLKQNQPTTLMFTMTVNGVPTAGLSLTAQRNFGSGFSPISGTITDLTGGDYKAALLAADTNSSSALYRFTATGADDRNIQVFLDP